jgi:ATP-dependent dihydroxyacetone kinase
LKQGEKSMAQFINAKETLVMEAIDGSLRASGGSARARLDGYPHIKVVVRTDHNSKRVAIISGGGSGHEPAHAGFVGKGLLTAAVCGEVFASPSVDAVFAAIMAVTGKAGCLLVFKNYTGDRLNFGLAAEKARALGKKVEVVVMRDDVSLPGLAQPRGIAGVMFIHKIAGYLAEKGESLTVVAAAARKVAESTISLGISLNSCTLPGIGREDRVPDGKAEVGLGIHGEPGVELVTFTGAKQAADTLMDVLKKHTKKAGRYALLLNNLGATTPLEMCVIANEILGSNFGRKIARIVGPAPMVTSLDMHGVSASLLPLHTAWIKALDAPVEPAAWPGTHRNGKVKILKLPKELKAKAMKTSRNDKLKSLLQKSCDILISAEAELNALDAKVGDGDTGSSIATGARSVKREVEKLPLADLGSTLIALSDNLRGAMGGSSGVLLAIFFAAAGQAVHAGKDWPLALQAGLVRLMEYGGAKPGYRTMIDALAPALAALAGKKDLTQAAAAAEAGARATARMLQAGAGRSVYVPSGNLSGVADPGAMAVALLFDKLARQ